MSDQAPPLKTMPRNSPPHVIPPFIAFTNVYAKQSSGPGSVYRSLLLYAILLRSVYGCRLKTTVKKPQVETITRYAARCPSPKTLWPRVKELSSKTCQASGPNTRQAKDILRSYERVMQYYADVPQDNTRFKKEFLGVKHKVMPSPPDAAGRPAQLACFPGRLAPRVACPLRTAFGFASSRSSSGDSLLAQELNRLPEHGSVSQRFDLLCALWVSVAATTIQRAWRSFKRYRSLKSYIAYLKWHALATKKAVIIQRRVRRWLRNLKFPQESLTRDILLQRQDAAFYIQRFWAAYRLRFFSDLELVVNRVLSERALAAVAIQRVYRGYKTRLLIDLQASRLCLTWSWDTPGSTVEAVGTFTEPPWTQHTALQWNSFLQSYVAFLPSSGGSHRLQFIIDGKYVCDGSLPIASDDGSTYHNVINLNDKQNPILLQSIRRKLRQFQTTKKKATNVSVEWQRVDWWNYSLKPQRQELLCETDGWMFFTHDVVVDHQRTLNATDEAHAGAADSAGNKPLTIRDGASKDEKNDLSAKKK